MYSVLRFNKSQCDEMIGILNKIPNNVYKPVIDKVIYNLYDAKCTNGSAEYVLVLYGGVANLTNIDDINVTHIGIGWLKTAISLGRLSLEINYCPETLYKSIKKLINENIKEDIVNYRKIKIN